MRPPDSLDALCLYSRRGEFGHSLVRFSGQSMMFGDGDAPYSSNMKKEDTATRFE